MVSLAVSFLVLAMSSVVLAQIPSLGWCPEYLPMADFDMGRYLGKWYEAERYFTFSELASRCVTTDYAKTAGGKIQLSNEITNRLTGVKRVIGGALEVVGREGEKGKLHIRLNTLPVATESTLVVLDTDYDTYSVVWSCSGIGPVHSESAWVMTRDRLPSGVVLQKAYGVLDKFKISRTFFVKTDQEGCAIAASEINAANGITGIPTDNEALRSNVPAEPAAAPEVVENAVQVPEPVVASIIKSEIPAVEEPALLAGASGSALPNLKAEIPIPVEEPVPVVSEAPVVPETPVAPVVPEVPIVPVPLPAEVAPSVVNIVVPLPVAPVVAAVPQVVPEVVPEIQKAIPLAEHILSKVETPVAPLVAEKLIVEIINTAPLPAEPLPVAPSAKIGNKVREAHKNHKA